MLPHKVMQLVNRIKKKTFYGKIESIYIGFLPFDNGIVCSTTMYFYVASIRNKQSF